MTIRLKIIIALSVLVTITLMAITPIAQDLNYHLFSNDMTLWGLPRFYNVISNLPFIIIGLAGFYQLAKTRWQSQHRSTQLFYWVFFTGLFLTGFGSGYYHYEPNNHSLVWDRLPMTIAFMSLFSLLIYHYLSEKIAIRLFWPLLIIGAASVAYWHVTESAGRGDLRPYALVQFLPMLIMPVMIIKNDSPLLPARLIWWALVFYSLAKLFEHFDHEIFELTGFISGHPIKHLWAAIGGGVFLAAIKNYGALQPNTVDT